MLSPTSPEPDKYAKATGEGYLISLPASGAPLPPAGLLTQFRVRGDFDISASYEIVDIDMPASGYGSGAALFVMCDSRDGATVARFSMPKIGGVVATDRMFPAGATGENHDVKSAPVRSKSGKLRLVREGALLKYMVADGDEDFKEIRQEQFVKSDLTTVRLAADTGLSTGKLVVRFSDFSVRAKSLPLGPATESEAREQITLWLLGSLLAGSIVIAGALIINRRRPATTAASQSERSQT